ncbi:MAG: hypothetical protein KF709_14800 [Gemmatimonadaceae bacterium]|nr:hypothetical protein [Gemmatimonadaceae bacterium]
MTKTRSTGPGALEQLEAEDIGYTLKKYQKPLTIAAVVIAIGAGGFYFAKRSAEIREARGYDALAQAEALYGGSDQARAQEELNRVVNRYAGTTAGTQAAHLSAQLYYADGKVDEGLALVETALAKAAAPQRAALLALRGAGKASKGEDAAAAADYEAAAAAADLSIDAQQYRMEAARHHVQAGNVAAGRALYETIADREDSPYASEAKLRLGEISVKG